MAMKIAKENLLRIHDPIKKKNMPCLSQATSAAAFCSCMFFSSI
jgi:hypothetical protein